MTGSTNTSQCSQKLAKKEDFDIKPNFEDEVEEIENDSESEFDGYEEQESRLWKKMLNVYNWVIAIWQKKSHIFDKIWYFWLLFGWPEMEMPQQFLRWGENWKWFRIRIWQLWRTRIKIVKEKTKKIVQWLSAQLWHCDLTRKKRDIFFDKIWYFWLLFGGPEMEINATRLLKMRRK